MMQKDIELRKMLKEKFIDLMNKGISQLLIKMENLISLTNMGLQLKEISMEGLVSMTMRDFWLLLILRQVKFVDIMNKDYW